MGDRGESRAQAMAASSLPDPRILWLSAPESEKEVKRGSTVVVAQSTCDKHLAVSMCVLATSASPDALPWLSLGLVGWVAVPAESSEESLVGDVFYRLFVMRIHLELVQRSPH